MSHRHSKHHHKKTSKSREWLKSRQDTRPVERPANVLECVLKCSSAGSVEAVTSSVSNITVPGIDISIIHSGIGQINSSDIMIAKTGSGLIIGYEVDVLPGLEESVRESGVEVRLYDVIYNLTNDIRSIAQTLVPTDVPERIIGSARVIALFKSSRKGVILGCEVLNGFLAHGRRFRIISAMGPVYSGRIESMQIERTPVQKATPGQKVGIKIRDFNRAKIGDLVESYTLPASAGTPAWKPVGEIRRGKG